MFRGAGQFLRRNLVMWASARRLFFPFSVRGQGLGTRRLYVTSCCTARKSTERETCRIFPDYHALKSVHLQNLTPSRNLVSHVHKGMVAIIFLGDCRKPNSSHEPSVDFFFFFFLNRLLVTEWRRLSHLFTRHIIHCACHLSKQYAGCLSREPSTSNNSPLTQW